MPCNCKKRMKSMENSTSPAVRAAAAAIRPMHNVAMKVVDKVDELRGVEPESEAEQSG